MIELAPPGLAGVAPVAGRCRMTDGFHLRSLARNHSPRCEGSSREALGWPNLHKKGCSLGPILDGSWQQYRLGRARLALWPTVGPVELPCNVGQTERGAMPSDRPPARKALGTGGLMVITSRILPMCSWKLKPF